MVCEGGHLGLHWARQSAEGLSLRREGLSAVDIGDDREKETWKRKYTPEEELDISLTPYGLGSRHD
jgi:hypothetical protein